MKSISLVRKWRKAPRRWGNPLHSICSYFAMFPPYIPHYFIRWLTEPGDVVYDPFSGRGTAPLEACLLGRVGLGSDANPLAHILTSAKVSPPSRRSALARLRALRDLALPSGPLDAPNDIQMLYQPGVLRQLVLLREELDLGVPRDRFIAAMLAGVLHANYSPGAVPRGLSISMPNTFAMSPNYVRGYIRRHHLEAPKVDTFDLVERRLNRLYPHDLPTLGEAWCQDVRARLPRRLLASPAKLIFTSPPYLQVIRYGKYNWIRLWMLKQDARCVDSLLVATSSLPRYLEFMKESLRALRPALRDDGFLCLMIGDVRDRATRRTTNLAEEVWQRAARDEDWHCAGIIVDRLPARHKVSRIWNSSAGNATKTDRILVLSKRKLALPPPPKIDWNEALDAQGDSWQSHPN